MIYAISKVLFTILVILAPIMYCVGKVEDAIFVLLFAIVMQLIGFEFRS